ncbi:hypothetical protein DITRI_Ditri13aG0090600 [Diplodiscus trichospermus]
MVSTKNGIFMLTIIASFAISFGAVYRVGDASGWHPIFDYQKWASSKNFPVGDTIRFEYNVIFHKVKEVTKLNYQACNATKPIATHYSGSDHSHWSSLGTATSCAAALTIVNMDRRLTSMSMKLQAPAPVLARLQQNHSQSHIAAISCS